MNDTENCVHCKMIVNVLTDVNAELLKFYVFHWSKRIMKQKYYHDLFYV